MAPFDLDAAPEPSTATTLADFETALSAIAGTLETNAAKGDAWRRQTPAEHVAHALEHVLRWQRGNNLQDLASAATRLLMGLELARTRAPEPMPGVLGLGLLGDSGAEGEGINDPATRQFASLPPSSAIGVAGDAAGSAQGSSGAEPVAPPTIEDERTV